MPQININRFDGGISDDPRQNTSNGFVISKHFDIFSYPHKLVPLRSTEADTNDGSTATGMKQYDVRNFQLGANGKLYGIGIQPGSTTRVKVVSKADPTTGNWTLEATAECGLNGGASFRDSFMEWGTTPAFWMFGGTGNISKWTIGNTFTDAVAATSATVTHVAQSVKAKDNNMYMFFNNIVVRVTPAGATSEVLTLPADGRITSACTYGNYLAIAWAKGTTATAGGYSRLFIWDMVQVDVQEAVDFGEGQLMVVGNVDGGIIGVVDSNLSTSLGIMDGSVFIKRYTGDTPIVLKEIKANQVVSSGLFIRNTVVKAGKLYFVAAIPFNGSTTAVTTFNFGIYAFGRKNINSNYALTLEYTEPAIDTSNYVIRSFGNAGNYWFINHSVDGSITKTDDAANYTTTSVYESQKFLTSQKKKKLMGIWVTFEYLPTNGQVVLKYRKDEETSYTPIFTETTANALSHEAVCIESTGGALPEFKEIQLRIESTFGAVITGYGFNYEELTGLTN